MTVCAAKPNHTPGNSVNENARRQHLEERNDGTAA
jgi:hypothetical protein